MTVSPPASLFQRRSGNAAWLGIFCFVLPALTACGGGSGGTDTSPATVPAPVITGQPASAASSSGGSVTFSVQATSPGALTYQWRRDGVDVPGATSGSLQVSPLTTADSGSQWSVAVCNAGACAASAPATLTVALKGLEFLPASLDLKPNGIGATADGGLFLTDSKGVYQLGPNGKVANGGKPLIAQDTAWGVAADGSGGAYVTHFNPRHLIIGFRDRLARYLDRVGATGASTLVAGTPAPHPNDTSGFPLQAIDGMGAVATLLGPFAVARDTQGNTYVTDAVEYEAYPVFLSSGSWKGCSVRKIAPSGQVSTLGGTPPVSDHFWMMGGRLPPPCAGLVVDAQGNAYFTANDDAVRKVSPSGQVGILAGVAGRSSTGFTNGSGAAARLNRPSGLALERDGDLLVADTGNQAIRKIAKDGTVSTLIDLTQIVNIDGWTEPVAIAQGEGRSLWLLLQSHELLTDGFSGGRLARMAY